MYANGYDYCPNWVNQIVYTCDPSTSGIDFDKYFDCGTDSCNDIDSWGMFYSDGDFCEWYDSVDEFYFEYCDEWFYMTSLELDFCPDYVDIDPNCVNDDSSHDSYGDTCSEWYDDSPSGCGLYDDSDFISSDQCCACGGGTIKDPNTVEPEPETCFNDDSTQDSYGDTCSDWYDDNPTGCGNYDDVDFTASEQCCACDGGCENEDGCNSKLP